LTLLAAACGTKRAVETGIGATDPMVVQSVVKRGDYLDAWIEGDGMLLRTFAKVGGICDVVLQPDRTVVYTARGPGGRYTQGEHKCDASGVGDPFVSRLRARRGPAGAPIPRAQATFEPFFNDEDVIMMRGRFPLTNLVGWSGGGDAIAVVRNHALCRTVAEKGVASMEYRPSGKNTLALLGPDGLCRIDGLILPQSETQCTPGVQDSSCSASSP